jgi:hypothetical protein
MLASLNCKASVDCPENQDNSRSIIPRPPLGLDTPSCTHFDALMGYLYGLLFSILKNTCSQSVLPFHNFRECGFSCHVTRSGEKGFSAVPTAIVGSRDRTLLAAQLMTAALDRRKPSAISSTPAAVCHDQRNMQALPSSPGLFICFSYAAHAAMFTLNFHMGSQSSLCRIVSIKCKSCDWILKQPEATRMSSSSILLWPHCHGQAGNDQNIQACRG